MVKWTIPPADRPKHARLMMYVMIALILAMFGRLFLGFDLILTLGYGVAAYVLLNILNYRAVFLKTDIKQPPDRKS